MRRTTVIWDKENAVLHFPRFKVGDECGCFLSGHLVSSPLTYTLAGLGNDSESWDGVPLQEPIREDLIIKDPPSPMPKPNTEIKMTPYLAIGNETTFYPFRRTTIRRYASGEQRKGWEEGGNACYLAGVASAIRRTTHTYDEKQWLSYPNTTLYPLQPRCIDTEINRVIGDTVSRASLKWDALTDTAELRSTLATASLLLRRAEKPLTTIADAIAEAAQNRTARRKLASEWLQFQYGIMPVIYSLSAILEKIREKETRYETARSRLVIHDRRSMRGKAIALTKPGERAVYEENNITYTITGVGKLMYETSADQLLSGIGFNPLRTAWDLTKYSLVVDWFLDVSTRLTTLGAALSLDGSAKFCYAVKKTGSTTRYAYWPHTEETTKVRMPEITGVQPFFCTPSSSSKIPLRDEPLSEVYAMEEVSSIKTYHEYERVLFTPLDHKLKFDVRLNSLRRAISALSLAVVTLKL